MASDVDTRTFIRILPESDGDRVGFFHTFNVPYSSRTRAFVEDEIVVDLTTGAQAKVLKDTADNQTANTGVLSVILEPGYEELSYTNGGPLQVLGSTIATADGSGYCVYVPRSAVAGGNNPHNLQYVDNQGQAYTRFGEGSPQFDAFGKMQISQAFILEEHIFTYSEHPDNFYDIQTAGASIIHQPLHSGTLLTTPTTSSATVERTSHQYYRYQAGTSQLIEMTAAFGDTGKANNIRYFGYGDEEDGVFFVLYESTVNVLLRSSVTGSVVDTRIAKSNWNVDKLDGSLDRETNPSRMNLDITKDNIYWIDFQWLGAGRIRYGIFGLDGSRITCHEIENANTNSFPYMRSGTLPVHAGNINFGGTTGSTSELRVWCMVVKTEGEYEPHQMHRGAARTNVPIIGNASSTHIATVRAVETLNGLTNRGYALMRHINLLNEKPDVPVIVEVVKNNPISGETWGAIASGAVIEVATDGTITEGGTIIWTGFNISYDTHDLSDVFTVRGETIKRHANASAADSYTIRARTITAGASVNLATSAHFGEIA